MKKVRVFDIANEVLGIVGQSKPSTFVPFKGKFPLLSPALQEEYYKKYLRAKQWMKFPYGFKIFLTTV